MLLFGEGKMKKIRMNPSAFKKYKKPILNLLFMLVTVAAVSLVVFLLLMAFDIISISDGIHFNEELFHSFKNSWYGWIIFIVIMSLLSVLLFAIPSMSMAFTLLTQAIYQIPWQVFLLSLIRVMISSTLLYTIGYFGGNKICEKILGKEDSEKALGLIRTKGTVYFPVMMMFPIFPDDALVMIAGTLKMSLNWFIPSIIFGRGIGVATVVFGIGAVPFEKFTSVWHWILFVGICLLGIVFVFFMSHKLNKWIDKKRKIKDINIDSEENETPTENSENAKIQ